MTNEKFIPEKYAELVKSVDIKKIQLNSLTLSEVCDDLETMDSLKVSLEFDNSEFTTSEDKLIIYSKFFVNVSSEENNSISTAFKMDFTYKLTYSITDICNYSEEYLNFFASRNVPVNIWPYARELISSSSTRLGLPTIIIEPLRKI
ncbi:protein-export chaperone SecB [Paraclostridium sordellii]|uniref:protein-export chaperone SecB n=1 Tax=Paraclostridium sordellii TaxID=1505 RepID=UPI000E4CED55|nr:protein-export chaperone SecB [Paeniclostridium sordellii]RGX10517.1 hypothetical protein DWV40_06000 [Paeniclostridium sordellii]